MISLLELERFSEYKLLDSGGGERLERFGKYLLRRPDPQVIWKKRHPDLWEKVDAQFIKEEEKEGWRMEGKIPEKWPVQYKNLTFFAKLAPFKHTGIFPEQAVHWDFIQDLITKSSRTVKILNLFAYTGIASLAAASKGARVTHVDASRPSIGWAKENQKASGLPDTSIRWILDDVTKFVEREVRRGVRYDGIILDPPVYGHGPTGERWDFQRDFPNLLKKCRDLLTEHPLFVVVNAYAISSSSMMLENVMDDYFSDLQGKNEAGELVIREEYEKRYLSTGIFARWSNS